MNLYQITLIVILVLFLPIAMMAMLVMPNEYAGLNLQAIDCDGPIAVMLFVIPCYLVYSVGLFSFARSFYHHRKWSALVIGIFCCLLMIALSFNTIAAYQAHEDVNHKEMCGEDW